jgi:hypothetical protein
MTRFHLPTVYKTALPAPPAIAVLLATGAGCGTPPPPAGFAVSDSMAPPPVHESVEYLEAADMPSLARDLGIGVVYFPMKTPVQDERLVLRTLPDASAGQVAEFRFYMPDESRWFYDVSAKPGDTFAASLVEYGYEESGLPLDSIAADGRWARVIYGYAPDGSALLGWAALEGVEHVLWRDWLPTRAAFFLEPGAALLADRPDGAVIDLDLARTSAAPPHDYDYHLEPDSVAGDWLRLRVVTPSDACGLQPVDRREVVGWTRYIDERGRPLVWFFSRGC